MIFNKRHCKKMKFSIKNFFRISSQIADLVTPPKKFRNSRPEVFSKKGVVENFKISLENTCARVSFLINMQALCSESYGHLKKNLSRVKA